MLLEASQDLGKQILGILWPLRVNLLLPKDNKYIRKKPSWPSNVSKDKFLGKKYKKKKSKVFRNDIGFV